MADRRVYAGSGGGGSNLSVLLQNQRVPSSSEPTDTFFLSGSSPSFLGSSAMVSFEDVHKRNRTNNGSFFCPIDQEDNGDEDFDEYLTQPGKKRRLSVDQVRFLEKSFELENKLEPERKVSLAKDLGLQPRQVAIWFQNRRARWKSKQLEKDYEVLHASYNSLKVNYDNLLREKDSLRAEVLLLTDKLLLKEKDIDKSQQLSDDNNVSSQVPPQDQPIAESVSEGEESKVSTAALRQDDLNSDVFNSESPHYTDGGHSYVFEHDHSDLSQDEEENLSNSLLSSSVYVFPKLEDADYSDSPANSCNLAFPVEDQAIWSWCF